MGMYSELQWYSEGHWLQVNSAITSHRLCRPQSMTQNILSWLTLIPPKEKPMVSADQIDSLHGGSTSHAEPGSQNCGGEGGVRKVHSTDVDVDRRIK